MERLGDQDNKSKEASAQDRAHDSEPSRDANPSPQIGPTRDEIAERAHRLWLEQGKPPNSAERNWLEAERELNAAAKSRSLLENVREKAGSVQR